VVGPVEGAAVGPVVDPAVAVVVAVAAVAAVIGQDRTGQYSVVFSSMGAGGEGLRSWRPRALTLHVEPCAGPAPGYFSRPFQKVGKDRTARNCTVQY
jgi:hypothetical protein